MAKGINTQVVKANQNASEVSYNNTISWLTATNVNSAIDELKSIMVPYSWATQDINLWANSLIVDTNLFFVDATNNRIWVGTITPVWFAEFIGTWASGRGFRVTELSTSKSNGVYTFEVVSSAHTSNLTSAWAMSVTVNSWTALVVNGQGNTWLWTSSPSARLEVSGSITLTAWTATNDIIVPTRGQRIRIGTYGTLSETVSGAAYIQWNNIAADRTLASTLVKTASASDGCQYIAMRYDRGVWIGTGIWAWNAAGTTYADTVNTRLMITTAGNVWINEFIPDYRLDVNWAIWFTPWSSVTPVDNGDVVFEATSNTQFTIKYRGTDSVIRSSILTLS